MSTTTCQTCYSELSPSTRPYLTPCCDCPICDRCLTSNPRLREYNPCLRCGDVRSVAGSSKVRIGDTSREERERQEERDQFQIGDDEDEEDDVDTQPEERSRPPSYTEPNESGSEAVKDQTAGGESAEVDMEIVEVTHPISKGDTLSSIARKYAADPHDLLTLNNLPPAALHTNPRLIQTRKILIISRRLIPRGTAPLLLSPMTISSLTPEEAEKRESERRLKRFQLLTKTTDPGVGKAYLALAEDEVDRHVLETGSGEVLAKEGPGGEGGGKKVISKGGKEGRALEAYYEDEEWETEVGGVRRVKEGGRWVVVGRGIGAGSSGLGLGLKA